MRTEWRKYLGESAPRYTSFPSALQFDSTVDESDFVRRLNGIDLYEPLSLYVHIPYCRQLCWYCGCNMRVENSYERARDYVDALVKEIALCGRALNGRGRPMSVHFGGGTPNYLRCDDLNRILTAIEQEIGLTDNANLAIELDPRILRDDDIDHLVSIGFNRFSLGVQDFDPTVQKAINRLQSFELIEACVSDSRSAGVDDLSFDILYGLPRQTPERFAQTLDKTVSLSPDRISVFGYAHLPNMLPWQKMIDPNALPSAELRSELVTLADETLIEAGYVRIGFDHYAKPENALAKASMSGRLRRNFQGFTDDPAATVIGFGASAISFVDGLYVQNEKAVKKYIDGLSGGIKPVARGLIRTSREEIIAAAINDLLCDMRANVDVILRNAPPDEALRICGALEQFEIDGVIQWQGDIISICDDAYGLARSVAMTFDPYAHAKTEYAATV